MRKNQMKIVASALALALAVGSVTAPEAAEKVAVAAQTEEPSVIAEPTTKKTIDDLMAVIAKEIITSDADIGTQEKRFQMYKPLEQKEQMKWLAESTYGNKKLKYSVYDANNDGWYELFAYASDGVLRIYKYDAADIGDCIKNIKNGKEVRKVSTKKGTFTVKQVSGKKTTYTTYTFNGTKLKKGTVYTKNNKTYKKGSKKIKKAAFDKYVKSYKKLKKIKTLGMGNAPKELDTESDYVYMKKGEYILRQEGAMEGTTDTLVMHTDSEIPGEPYRAFYQHESAAGITKERVIFGQDAEKDWNSMLSRKMNVTTICPVLASISSDRDDYVLKDYEYDADNQTETYTVGYNDEFGEGDLAYQIVVLNGNLWTVYEQHSDGSRAEYWTMLGDTYGVSADIDGQQYEPESDVELFDPEKFGASTTRSITVDYAGTPKTIKTSRNALLSLYPWTEGGRFEVTGEDGSVIKVSDVMETADTDKLENYLNPDSSDITGYGDVTAAVKWIKE